MTRIWDVKDQKINYLGKIYKCEKCGRKIFVERCREGKEKWQELSYLHVSCWSCLDKEERDGTIRLYGLDKESK